MTQLSVDKEFKNLIPPLTDDELRLLEESILADGVRDALVTWHGVIVDGHNRYAICQKYGLPFETVETDFESRDAAIEWIIKNQFGRRNLPLYERAMLALRLKPVIAERAKEQQVRKPQSVLQNSAEQKPIDTRQEIAKAAGVSHDTIAKVEKIEANATEETKEALRRGEMSINQAFAEIKRQEKEAEIKKAKQDIADQQKERGGAILHIGDGIGFNPIEKYDLLLTDPPFSTDVPDISEFANRWLYPALAGVKDTGFAYVFIGAYPNELQAYLEAIKPSNVTLEQVLIWTYKNTLGQNPKGRYKQNYQACLFFRGVNAPDLNCPLTSEQWAVQEINAPDGRQGDRYHAWQKPMEIAERFIRHSTKPGMTVFDPFACTGTFLLAAAKLGRKAYGFEIDPDNAAIAFERGCERG